MRRKSDLERVHELERENIRLKLENQMLVNVFLVGFLGIVIIIILFTAAS